MTDIPYFPAPSSANQPEGEIISPPDMRALAMSYAEAGYYVSPLAVGSKIPRRGSHGKDDATNDPAKVRHWWTANDGSLKNWNIGIRGKGLLILDFDPKKSGQTIDELIAAFKEKYGRLPKGTPIVKTPKGGLHTYLRLPEGIRVKNSVGKILPGVDIRGEDGYVLSPGSHTEATPDGKLVTGDYVLREGLSELPPAAELPEAPAWLIEAAAGVKSLEDDDSPVNGRGAPPGWADNEFAVAAAIKYLIDEAPELGEGERDDGLIKIANRIMDFGVSPDMAGGLIAEHWNEAKCFPPVPPEDIMEKVRNAARSGHSPIGCRPPPPAAEDVFERLSDAELKEIEQSAVDRDWRSKGDGEQAVTEGGIAPERKHKRFEFIGFDDVELNTKPEYLIYGLLPRVGLCLVWGPKGCGKSFFVYDLLMHVARGLPYRGRDVEQGAIVYCALEGSSGFKNQSHDSLPSSQNVSREARRSVLPSPYADDSR